MNGLPNTIVKLMVKNHPGAMSHITGLFSRRAFNLEGILCAPVDGGADSAMYLLVRNVTGGFAGGVFVPGAGCIARWAGDLETEG